MNLSGIIGGIRVGEQETKLVSQEPHASGFEAVRVFSKYPKVHANLFATLSKLKGNNVLCIYLQSSLHLFKNSY